MGTPEHEVDMIRREYLESENLELLKEDLAFAVSRRIVKYNDPDLLTRMPLWVGPLVREMCEIYTRDGCYKIASNLGEADHSEMVRKLAELLERKA